MILAILQARTSSRRLPGKVLKPILGEPMLWRQLERIQRAQRIGTLCVATSQESSDDPIEACCQSHGISCFRGSLDDVLDRFYQAAKPHQPEHVVRLTADCPLADPALIDQTIELHLRGAYDYTSNAVPPSFPDGLDVEIMRFTALEAAWKDARLTSEREHVTSFLYKNPQRFKIGVLRAPEDWSSLRWTVDEPEDFAFVSAVYNALYPKNAAFSTRDIFHFLDKNPQFKTMNAHIPRNAGYQASLKKDSHV